MASAYLGLVTIAGELGIGTAVVTLRNLSLEQLAQSNSLAVALGVAGGAASIAARRTPSTVPSPQLPGVVIVLSLAFVFTAPETDSPERKSQIDGGHSSPVRDSLLLRTRTSAIIANTLKPRSRCNNEQ